MSNKKSQQKKAEAKKLPTVEQLAKKHKLPQWKIVGLKKACGWGEGKEITEEEFTKALDGWLKGPMVRKGEANAAERND